MKKIIDLNGNRIDWRAVGDIIQTDFRPRSKYHVAARELLQKLYPSLQLKEEVPIPIRPRQTLVLDFFIPVLGKAVEVQGEQHYSFNSLFHNSKLDFVKQTKNDRDKQEWCSINGITLVILKYNEQSTWEHQLSTNS